VICTVPVGGELSGVQTVAWSGVGESAITCEYPTTTFPDTPYA
jgi:hypothetical protein